VEDDRGDPDNERAGEVTDGNLWTKSGTYGA